jgi:hypothetical protein
MRRSLTARERGTRTEEVLSLRAAGLGEAAIAERLGMHPGSVACMVWRARKAGDPRAAKLPREVIRARRAALRMASATKAQTAQEAAGDVVEPGAAGAGPQRPAPSPQSCASQDPAVSSAHPPLPHASLTVAGGEHGAEVVRGVGQSVRGLGQSVRAPGQVPGASRDG